MVEKEEQPGGLYKPDSPRERGQGFFICKRLVQNHLAGRLLEIGKDLRAVRDANEINALSSEQRHLLKILHSIRNNILWPVEWETKPIDEIYDAMEMEILDG